MATKSYIACLPSDLLVRATQNVQPEVGLVDGVAVRVFWPFSYSEGAGRAIEQPRTERIPGYAGSPAFRQPPLQVRLEIRAPEGCVFCDGLRLDFDAPVDSERAEDVARRLVRNLRAVTGQWWLGHAYREGEGIVRTAYDVYPDGSLNGTSAEASMLVRPAFPLDQPLDHATFVHACTGLFAGVLSPQYLEQLYDAVYFFIGHGDVRRAILEACVALEMAVFAEAVDRGKRVGKAEQAIRKRLSNSDLLYNLSSGLPKVFGQAGDFSKVSSSDFATIRQLVAARGQIAHGQAPAIGEHGRGALPDRPAAAGMLLCAFRVVEWLREFK